MAAADCLQEAQLADVKWQQAVFEVLLSYHPFWLRLGLETVVGQLLPADSGKYFFAHRDKASITLDLHSTSSVLK